MPPVDRKKTISVRLSEDEWKICEEMTFRKGIDSSSIMRQAMLDWAAREGIQLPTKAATPAKPAPKKHR